MEEKNEYERKIRELEEKLSNYVIPKYKIGQTVYWKPTHYIYSAKVENIKVNYKGNGMVKVQYVLVNPEGIRNHKNERDLFATEQDARVYGGLNDL